MRRSGAEAERARQVARRQRPARGEGRIARGKPFEQRQIMQARDEAHDRRGVVEAVIDLAFFRIRRHDDGRDARTRTPAVALGGATWSHQPPFSSKVMTTTMSFHCGDFFKCSITLATCASPDSTSE